MTKLKVFDYVNSITAGRENLMRGTEDDDEAERGYNAYLTNMALSYHLDTILHANLTNINHHLDSRPQYEFLFTSIRKKKRFSKWYKPVDTDDLDLVCDHYKVNRVIGREYLDLLTPESIEEIKKQYDTGG